MRSGRVELAKVNDDSIAATSDPILGERCNGFSEIIVNDVTEHRFNWCLRQLAKYYHSGSRNYLDPRGRRIAGQALNYRMQPGDDHSYWFIASLIEDHLKHHALILIDQQ